MTLAFDVDALKTYCEEHVPDWHGAPLIEKFSGGQSNPTYLLRAEHRAIVMRTKPAPTAELLPSAHAVDREFKVMRALHSTGFPVPRMFACCDDESRIGLAFYLMEYVEGRIFWDPSLPDLDRSTRAAMYDEVGHVLTDLHRVDPATVGLADFGKPGNYFARQIARWSRQYRASETTPIDAMHRLIEWLPANVPTEPDEPTTIVHGDFRLDNLVWHPTESRVIAVLDWELSTLGHPIADLSYYAMAWNIPAGGFRGMAGLDFDRLGIPTESEFVSRYVAATGFEPVGPWHFYLAYNLFRIAAIVQGVAKRAEEGSASSQQAREVGAQARPLAELAWRMAQHT